LCIYFYTWVPISCYRLVAFLNWILRRQVRRYQSGNQFKTGSAERGQKGQAMIYKTQHRNLKIEQHEPN
jgi:hypothetical protein